MVYRIYALNYFKLEAPRVIEQADTEEVVLVDHNEASQSVANLADVTVAGVYDHHKINFTSAAPLWFINKPLGSVATLLYYEYKDAGIEIPAKIAGLMLSAIISDTLLLKSPTTTSADKPALEGLAKIAGLDDYEAYGLEMLKAGTDLSTKSAKDLIDGDAKSFELAGQTVRIGQVNTVDVNDVFARRDEIAAAIETELAEDGYSTFVFVVTPAFLEPPCIVSIVIPSSVTFAVPTDAEFPPPNTFATVPVFNITFDVPTVPDVFEPPYILVAVAVPSKFTFVVS